MTDQEKALADDDQRLIHALLRSFYEDENTKRERIRLVMDAVESFAWADGAAKGKAIKVPAVSTREIRHWIERELSDNPLIELPETPDPPEAESTGPIIDEDCVGAEDLASLEMLDRRVPERFDSLLPATDDPTSEEVDVSVERDAAGAYHVKLELPSLVVSPYYIERLGSGRVTDEEDEFIREKLASAEHFIHLVEECYGVLRRMYQAIVGEQIDFLEHGVGHIVPTRVGKIAEPLGLPSADVSRILAGSRMQTPWGVLPLERFLLAADAPDADDADSTSVS